MVASFEVTVHYKKMKNVYLKLHPDGQIVVSAPIGTSRSYLEAFVTSRADWIEEKRQILRSRQAPLVVDHEQQTLLFGSVIEAALSQRELHELLHAQVKIYWRKYWDFFRKHGCAHVEIKYRKMTRTWGVCRPVARTITFNRQLVHQPLAFVEYVVLHELCHLLVPHHNRDFYDLVARHMPDFREREKMRLILEAQ